MDAEVWSHADIRNGQRLFPLLVLVVVCKEAAASFGLAAGLPWAAWLVPPGHVAVAWPPALQTAVALGLVVILLVLAYSGRGWALVGLGLTYLVSSGSALWALAPQLTGGAGETLPLPLTVALANGGLGLAIGAAALFLPQLRAYIWSRASARLVIPLPDDEAPPRRSWRKQRTLTENVIALGQGLINLVLILVVLLVALYVYGFGDDLLRLLRTF